MRVYIIINIQEPAGAFTHGIRDWVASSVMRGRPVEGTVKRSLFDSLPSVTVKVTGTSDTLDAVFTALQSDKWTVSKLSEIILSYSEFVHLKFVIIQSDRGAMSGPNSDNMNDNKSESSTSSRRSSKSGKSG